MLKVIYKDKIEAEIERLVKKNEILTERPEEKAVRQIVAEVREKETGR